MDDDWLLALGRAVYAFQVVEWMTLWIVGLIHDGNVEHFDGKSLGQLIDVMEKRLAADPAAGSPVRDGVENLIPLLNTTNKARQDVFHSYPVHQDRVLRRRPDTGQVIPIDQNRLEAAQHRFESANGGARQSLQSPLGILLHQTGLRGRATIRLRDRMLAAEGVAGDHQEAADAECLERDALPSLRAMLVVVFERFTERARRVLVLAQQQARLLNHNFIGTEHILLGLIDEQEGIAAKALESLGIRLEAVREKVEETVGPAGSSTTGSPPFTPRSKKVLELSLREALQLGHNHIGTEHILLGLIREGEGVAVHVLVSLGADLSRVRQEVIRHLSGYQSPGGTAAAEVAASTPAPVAKAEPQRAPVTEQQPNYAELASLIVRHPAHVVEHTRPHAVRANDGGWIVTQRKQFDIVGEAPSIGEQVVVYQFDDRRSAETFAEGWNLALACWNLYFARLAAGRAHP